MIEVNEKKVKRFDMKKIFVKILAIIGILLMVASTFFTVIYYAIAGLK